MKGRGGWDHWYLVSLLRYRSPQLPLAARRVNEVRPAVKLKGPVQNLFSSARLTSAHITAILLLIFLSPGWKLHQRLPLFTWTDKRWLSTVTPAPGGHFNKRSTDFGQTLELSKDDQILVRFTAANVSLCPNYTNHLTTVFSCWKNGDLRYATKIPWFFFYCGITVPQFNTECKLAVNLLKADKSVTMSVLLSL